MMQEKAQIIFGDTNQPFAQRTVSAVLTLLFVLLVLGFFFGWWFYPEDHTVLKETPQGDIIVMEELSEEDLSQMPGNEYTAGTGRSKVYDFFYKMFGGIEDGLEENQLNEKIWSHAEEANLEGMPVQGAGDVEAPSLAINAIAERRAARLSVLNQDEYRNSVFDAVGSDVYDKSGDKAGTIHDIIVHKETGEARAIVMNDDELAYERDLNAIRFENVLKQDGDGDTFVTLGEDTIEDKRSFNYDAMNADDYVSLRHLRDGQLLDFEGNVLGQVDAILYENAEAHHIYFALKSTLVPAGQSRIVGVPYDEINVVDGVDGFDIQLTKEQTVDLATALFQQ